LGRCGIVLLFRGELILPSPFPVKIASDHEDREGNEGHENLTKGIRDLRVYS
jgi:hypothetical protein